MADLEDRASRLVVAEATGSALEDITNVVQDMTPQQRAEEASKHGWQAPKGYDYDRYNNPDQNLDSGTWASNAARYEWKEEYGDVAPRFPELEKQLFGSELANKAGAMEGLKFEVTIESETTVTPISSFDDAGLHPVMRDNVALCGYEKPTPIQAYCLPTVFTNHDLIAVAQTGSGKTAAFLIPVLSKLMGKAKKLAAPRPNPTAGYDPRVDGVRAEPLVVIVAPTRELAVQIFDDTRRLCYRSMLRPCVAYGGAPAREQAAELRRGCDILIGTPGRIIDFMGRSNLLSFKRVRYTIIDEADEMVADDWSEEMSTIMSGGDNNEDADHRYLMFSATFPKGARALARKYLSEDYIRIKVGRPGSTPRDIQQMIVEVAEENKRRALNDLLLSLPPARTIVFVNSKKSADLLDDFLYNGGFPSTSIHAERTQQEREDALSAFRKGQTPILVTTGVTGRGLDIINVMHVINYDLPSSMHGGISEYVHRIGRTARIGNRGHATSFYNERNEDIALDLVRLLLETRQTIPEFLAPFKPADSEALNFQDDSEDEADDTAAGQAGGADAWGAPATEGTTGDGWGNAATATADGAAPATDDWGTAATADAGAADTWKSAEGAAW